MKIKIICHVLIIILFSLFLFDCENDNNINIDNNCDSVLCTAEFRHYGIKIYHKSDSSAYLLTNYKVIRVSDNRKITIVDNNLADNNGYYPITNDTKMVMFQNKNIEVEFKGYLNGALVIKKRFIFTADCCHVHLVEGVTKFYI